MGVFYWLRVKNLDQLHTELSLGYLEDAKFYLESKASFITRTRSNPRYKLGRVSLFFFVMVVANCNASRDWLHMHCSQW